MRAHNEVEKAYAITKPADSHNRQFEKAASLLRLNNIPQRPAAKKKVNQLVSDTKIYCEQGENLPLICVCQTASPTPHNPAIAKKTNGLSGCGRQNSITITIDPWTIVPENMIKIT